MVLTAAKTHRQHKTKRRVQKRPHKFTDDWYIQAMKKTLLKKRSHHKGFTLLEVLLAMGIFAIGFVFIAAIFPVAALLQKEAADIVNTQQVVRNTKAIIAAITVSSSNINSIPNAATDQTVHKVPPTWLDGSPTIYWSPNVRSSPTSITDHTLRKFYWVPLVRDTNPVPGVSAGDVHIYVFVLQRRNNVVYPATSSYFTYSDIANPSDSSTIPKVFATEVTAISSNTIQFNSNDFNGDDLFYDSPLQLDIGDKFLDNNGTIYTVSDYNMFQNTITVDGILLPYPNPISVIWFASPGEDGFVNPSGKTSPTMDILLIPDAVQP